MNIAAENRLNHAEGVVWDVIPIQRKTGMLSNACIRRRTPPGFAWSASSRRPSIAKAHEVVIPQEGHRISMSRNQTQRGIPNCWCVPIPDAEGSRTVAVNTKSKRAMADANAARRIIGDNKNGGSDMMK